MIPKAFCLFFIFQVIIASEHKTNKGFLSVVAKLIRNLNTQYKTTPNSHSSKELNIQPVYDNKVKLFKDYLRILEENESSDVINIEDKMCKRKGKCSCGRTGVLCDVQDINEVADDVDELINNINRQVDRQIDENYNLLRCSTGRCGSNENFDKLKDNETNDHTSEDNIFIKDSPNQNLLQAVISEIKEITNSHSEEDHKLAKGIVLALTPEDFANYYRPALDYVRKTLLGYIRFRTNFKTVRELPRSVRAGIQSIREKYRHFKISDKALTKQIFNLLLGDVKKIKIIPNKDPQVLYDVFLPDWIYFQVLKKKQGRRSRSVKRVLPLTLHQKNRMQNKQQPKKVLKFNVWRRNLDSNKANYGVPFVLDIQGLGQIN